MVHVLGPISSKRAREQEGEGDEMEEIEIEDDDLDADMLALEGITNRTVPEVVHIVPINLTEPEKLWKTEVAFYEKLQEDVPARTPDSWGQVLTVLHRGTWMDKDLALAHLD